MRKTTARRLAILLFVALIFAVGCGRTPSGEGPSSPEQSSQEETPQTPAVPSWQEVVGQYPIAAELEEEIFDIYPIQGHSQGFLIFTGSNTEPGNLYYCSGPDGGCELLYQDFPASEFTAGMISPDALQITSREGIFQWDKDGFTGERPFPDDKDFDFSFDYAGDRLFWVDPQDGSLRYGELDPQGTTLWSPDQEDGGEGGGRAASRAAAPEFSGSGRLALFLESSVPYMIRPVLCDLGTGESWTEGEPWEAPAARAHMIGEEGVLTCYYQAEGQGWNRIMVVSPEGRRELELGFSYNYSYPGEDCLYLVDLEGDLRRFDLRSGQSETIYRAENPGVGIRTVLGAPEFEAILLVEIGRGSTASVIIPR